MVRWVVRFHLIHLFSCSAMKDMTMKSFLHWIAPPHPSMTPMNFSRMPVVHLFWGGGLIGAVVGFTLGFVLWMWLQGILDIPESYLLLKLWHGRFQIL